MMFVADTHSLVWYFEDNKKLGKQAEKTLSGTNNYIVCPTIVLAEILFLFRKGKISRSFDTLITIVSSDPRFTIYPLDEEVVRKIPPNLEMHDGIIVATALVLKESTAEEVFIISKDERISSLEEINVIW